MGKWSHGYQMNIEDIQKNIENVADIAKKLMLEILENSNSIAYEAANPERFNQLLDNVCLDPKKINSIKTHISTLLKIKKTLMDIYESSGRENLLTDATVKKPINVCDNLQDVLQKVISTKISLKQKNVILIGEKHYGWDGHDFSYTCEKAVIALYGKLYFSNLALEASDENLYLKWLDSLSVDAKKLFDPPMLLDLSAAMNEADHGLNCLALKNGMKIEQVDSLAEHLSSTQQILLPLICAKSYSSYCSTASVRFFENFTPAELYMDWQFLESNRCFVYLRDLIMATNIAKMNGNAIAIVGAAHLDGLLFCFKKLYPNINIIAINTTDVEVRCKRKIISLVNSFDYKKQLFNKDLTWMHNFNDKHRWDKWKFEYPSKHPQKTTRQYGPGAIVAISKTKITPGIL